MEKTNHPYPIPPPPAKKKKKKKAEKRKEKQTEEEKEDRKKGNETSCTHRLQAFFGADSLQDHDVAQRGEQTEKGQDHAQRYLPPQLSLLLPLPVPFRRPASLTRHVTIVPQAAGGVRPVGQGPVEDLETIVIQWVLQGGEQVEGGWGRGGRDLGFYCRRIHREESLMGGSANVFRRCTVVRMKQTHTHTHTHTNKVVVGIEFQFGRNSLPGRYRLLPMVC